MSTKLLAFLGRIRPGFTLTLLLVASVGLLLVGVLTGDSQRAIASPDAPQTADAFIFLTPGGGGNCAAPGNGGTTTVGCRFVLDMMVNAGTNDSTQPDGGICVHQSYLTFSSDLIKVARAVGIATACVVTNTLTPDLSVFDAVLQNETCNGPPDTSANCNFRGVNLPPGRIAYANGLLSNSSRCPNGCPNLNETAPWDQYVFRSARMGLCAVAPGQAVLHWQFAPPDPITRDSEMANGEGGLVHDRTLYTDYVINISAAPEAVMSGHVTWQGRPAQPNPLQQLPVTLTVKSGANEVNFSSQNTDSNGNFTVNITSLPSGEYNWRVKGPKFLASAGTMSFTGASITTALEMGLIRVGDSNNDNVVNISDFTIVKNAFGTTIGDPSYDDRADLNGDQIVTVSDVSQNRMNFGLSGAPAP